MAQRWERSPPTNVAWVRLCPGIICELSLLLAQSPLFPRVRISPVNKFFLPPVKRTQNFNSTEERTCLKTSRGWCGFLSKYFRTIIFLEPGTTAESLLLDAPVDKGFLFTFQLIVIWKDQGGRHPFTILDISVTKICTRLIPPIGRHTTTYSQTEAVGTLTRIRTPLQTMSS